MRVFNSRIIGVSKYNNLSPGGVGGKRTTSSRNSAPSCWDKLVLQGWRPRGAHLHKGVGGCLGECFGSCGTLVLRKVVLFLFRNYDDEGEGSTCAPPHRATQQFLC